MSALNYSLNDLIRNNKEGSYSTHANRALRLNQSINRLQELGYKPSNIRNLQGKHVRALVADWQKQKLSAGTIKNRVSDLRWLSRKIGNPRIVERDNSAYNIDRRQYVNNNINTAKELDNAKLQRITDEYTKYSLKLQAEFGLRREEAIKIQPDIADRGSHLHLQGSWCKGGRPRDVPVLTQSQRDLLNEIQRFCAENDCKSLIPKESTYKQQLKTYEYQTDRAEIHKNHGLRHAYAQQRYLDLTGRECPKNGGLTSRQLSPEDRKIDYESRLQISEELGHSREAITAVYLGR
jgi:site-specific recombinase XerD